MEWLYAGMYKPITLNLRKDRQRSSLSESNSEHSENKSFVVPVRNSLRSNLIRYVRPISNFANWLSGMANSTLSTYLTFFQRSTIRLCCLFRIRHVIGCINHDIQWASLPSYYYIHQAYGESNNFNPLWKSNPGPHHPGLLP